MASHQQTATDKNADKPSDAPTIASLLKKGEGRLVKVGSVWSYPGAPLDPSGTNVRLPIEHVPDAVVQKAIADEELRVLVTDATGFARSVVEDGEHTAHLRPINALVAGTAEAGTELPKNSRPTHDAGVAPMTPQQVRDAAHKAGAAVAAATKPAVSVHPAK